MIKRFSGVWSLSSRFDLERVVRCLIISSPRAFSTKAEIRKHRNEIFDDEKRRQHSAVGRIEKIKVRYRTWDEDMTLLMNKELSTPHDCARHISEGMTKLSAVATVNGVTWDMHRPLVQDCELQISTMRTPFDRSVNNAFWRTCSLILGSVIDAAFKDEVELHLHSFTSPNIKSGSFFYDVGLSVEDWKPTDAETRAISALFANKTRESLPVERLETSVKVALEIFKDNPFKTKQIPDIANRNDNKIVLYRIGEHIDISKGPMVGNTDLVGRCTVAAVHPITSEDGERLYRFQGVALPAGIIINHFVYAILEERAKKLNETVWMPRTVHEDEENIAASFVL